MGKSRETYPAVAEPPDGPCESIVIDDASSETELTFECRFVESRAGDVRHLNSLSKWGQG